MPDIKEITPPGLPCGIYFGLEEDKYHADPAFNKSGMVSILQYPTKYFLQSPFYTGEKKQKRRTDAMKTGTALHKLLLEPDFFFENYFIVPGKLGGPGMIALTQADYGAIKDQVDVLRGMPKLMRLLQNGYPEVTIIWLDEETGIRKRVRHDYLRAFMTIDFKSVRDLTDDTIKRQMNSLGYDIQNYLYLESIIEARKMLASGGDCIFSRRPIPDAWLDDFETSTECAFEFVFQEKEPPYPARVLQLDDMSLARGKEKHDRACALYRDCVMYGWDRVGDGTPEEFSTWHGSQNGKGY